MKIIAAILLLALSPALTFGEEAYSKVIEIPNIDSPQFPAVSLEAPLGGKIQVITSGKVGSLPATLSASLGEEPVVVDVTREYDLSGKKQSTDFQILYFGLASVVTLDGKVNKGDVLGSQGSRPIRVVAASTTLDPYLVAGGNRFPVKFGDRYWFSPSFLFSNGSTAYLTFDTNLNIEKTLSDVAAEASEDGPGYVFYPSYRIRFSTKLAELPVTLSEEEKSDIAGFENNLYGKTGLYKFKNEIVIGQYRYLLCWQSGFDKYLKDEYTLNEEIWLYGSIVSYDVWKKVGYVFLRDFSLTSAESILEKRLAMQK